MSSTVAASTLSTTEHNNEEGQNNSKNSKDRPISATAALIAQFNPIGAQEVISGIAPHVYEPCSTEGRRIARRKSWRRNSSLTSTPGRQGEGGGRGHEHRPGGTHGRKPRHRRRPTSAPPTPGPSPLREYVSSDDLGRDKSSYFHTSSKDDMVTVDISATLAAPLPSKRDGPPALSPEVEVEALPCLSSEKSPHVQPPQRRWKRMFSTLSRFCTSKYTRTRPV